ncbi:MAG: hypothetical protein IT580_10845, partial [Verrucomicrobiales bacterium]|nr:hypothetical protein [Verrucomicrobiales bacterium]
AWYDYAGVLASLKKPMESLNALGRAIQISDARRGRDARQKDLRPVAATDPRFSSVRNLPEWQRVTSPPGQ